MASNGFDSVGNYTSDTVVSPIDFAKRRPMLIGDQYVLALEIQPIPDKFNRLFQVTGLPYCSTNLKVVPIMVGLP